MPVLVPAGRGRLVLRDNPYGHRLKMRHYSQILPRDFDLSPNFEIIKFNIPDPHHFQYRRLPWVAPLDGTLPVSGDADIHGDPGPRPPRDEPSPLL